MARRLQNRMAELPDKQRRKTNTHGLGQIEENENVAENENAGAQKVKELIDQIAMRREMVVVLTLHDFRIKGLDRLRHLDEASEPFLE